MLTNVRTTRIEWGDCDPLGIIFYPRYFEIFDTSTTVLLERALEAQLLDVHLGIFGHIIFPDAHAGRRRFKDVYAGILWRRLTRPLTR